MDQEPKLDLATLFLSVSSSANLSLGESDLVMAKHNIDLLELLEIKTAGNRTDDEDKLLKHVLYDLRLKYVEKRKS